MSQKQIPEDNIDGMDKLMGMLEQEKQNEERIKEGVLERSFDVSIFEDFEKKFLEGLITIYTSLSGVKTKVFVVENHHFDNKGLSLRVSYYDFNKTLEIRFDEGKAGINVEMLPKRFQRGKYLLGFDVYYKLYSEQSGAEVIEDKRELSRGIIRFGEALRKRYQVELTKSLSETGTRTAELEKYELVIKALCNLPHHVLEMYRKQIGASASLLERLAQS